ncbi:hypothetical protein G6F46_003768 [Rhizopus delemar]|nr:hypothetical protein G6F43_004600 [Rhizopus delemar]KAG1541071.1 hypothetical protein G6F51_008132 [Rhizopus arrhizus]KAG1455429.1 hypothetical protein G6F55_007081 [Rhizopus delemar]KAG1495011.1 hypothetical protein G6F54_007473 [Rhizopus delemar]KAG1516466.1 hypothetical protein G6F53_002134 [Rhizopus delemar]
MTITETEKVEEIVEQEFVPTQSTKLIMSSSNHQWKQPTSSLSPPPRHPKSKRESIQIPIDYMAEATPRVKPRSIKGQQQSTLLRLSLDAECLESPTQSLEEEQESAQSSNISFGSTSSNHNRPTPIRSGTLGNSKRSSDSVTPPLPNSVEEETKRLSLKERRRQTKSLLVSTNTELLTLAIHEKVIDDQDLVLKDQSRQEAMMALEGKKTTAVAVQPIVNTQELDKHFKLKDKICRKSVAHKKAKGLEVISEISRIPETPPYHQQFPPTLISVPSTPNSMDSSLINDCITTQDHVFTN